VLHANHPGGAIGAKLDAEELNAELDALQVAGAELEAAVLKVQSGR
jgi:hypothetical protein